ncbi:MAG: leucine--tRNA ligase [Gammaproteobacteria bacterium]|nr:MAG: leucine--tRNA ligase [Gammaproteobacteria bacterium]
MHADYRPQTLEPEVQAAWRDHGKPPARADAPKFYCLSMFPYPSGRLHMGHVRNYTIGDVITRYQAMRGKRVFQPMGWDAFGLPAENAAIAHGVPPARWTEQNIEAMRAQLERLGFAYDWDHEIATCRPEYYRWEQWLFIQMYKRGLAYKKTALVNWDPVDQTVLANEQVIDGRGWRSGAPVEQRRIPQWFLKITAYADELLEGLDRLEGWPEAVKTMQRNWIGRSEGVEIDFSVSGREETLTVFTTRPDTLMGVTYVAIAAEHPLALECARGDARIAEFVESCRRTRVAEADLATLPKRGVPTGLMAEHPLTGETVPIWIANFVLAEYGSGAVMAVPAHDERDHAFALAHGLPIRPVVFPPDGAEHDFAAAAYTEPGVLRDAGPFSGLDSAQAFAAIADRLEALGRGRRRVNYRLRDWGVSRQRYWGAPIPMIQCPQCGDVPVPEDQLPVVLPTEVTFSGAASPLKDMPEFYRTRCPQCGGEARRETDTFDTFMESSWYYARYLCHDNDSAMLDARVDEWLPVDQYVGGIEHAVLHLLYARFYHKVLRDFGLVHCDEPFANLLTQGMVLKDGAKMSKSKGNTVDPQPLIERYGADTVRLFMMFAAPPEQALEWSDEGVAGAHRFLKRLWRLVHRHVEAGGGGPLPGSLDDAQRALRRKLHQTIAKVEDDIGRRYTFNTAIAAVMELVNALYKFEDDSAAGRAVRQEALEAVVGLLYPIVPHIGYALWDALGREQPVRWPVLDQAALAAETIEWVVQVNGRVRGRLALPADAAREDCERAALADENVQRHLEGRTVRRVIVVPGRLVNIVAG